MYYQQDPDAAFWDDHWRTWTVGDPYVAARTGSLHPLETPILRHLPRDGRVLEAGCGLGQHVLALRLRGYDAEGVDWASDTVALVRSRLPSLPIVVGDLERLPVPDGYYAGYLSIGVVEHRPKGPGPLLREAHRVLRPGGVALVSVPSFHVLRRLKARLGAYRDATETLSFYQYAFTAPEFGARFEECGFEVVDAYGYDSYKGIVDEVPGLAHVVHRQVGRYHVGALVQRALRRVGWIERRLGHMLLLVGVKRAT